MCIHLDKLSKVQSGADCFRAAQTFTFLCNDITKYIPILGVGEEDHLCWEKLRRSRKGAEKRCSHRAGSLSKAPVCVSKGGIPHPGAPVLQQSSP